jgi:plastocyanin
MKRKVLYFLVFVFAVSPFLFSQSGHMGHRIQKNLVFPHFVLGGGITSEVILLNPGPGQAVTGTLYFFNQDGTPLTVRSNGQPVTQIAATVPAGGGRFITVESNSNDLVVAWALFEAAGDDLTFSGDALRERLSGSIVFTRQVAGVTVTKVGVVTGRYETGGQRTLTFPAIKSGDVNTGVAVANSGPSALDLTIQLHDQSGNLVATANGNQTVSPLAPGNQRARFLTELFPGLNLAGFRGTMTILANGEGLVVTGLITDGDTVTTVPVVRVPSQSQAASHTVRSQGFEFLPDSIEIRPGDTVTWVLDISHNVVEVTEDTYKAKGNIPKQNGFSLPFGGGSIKFDTPGTYYYVCTPHASMGMRGKVVVKLDDNPKP